MVTQGGWVILLILPLLSRKDKRVDGEPAVGWLQPGNKSMKSCVWVKELVVR